MLDWKKRLVALNDYSKEHLNSYLSLKKEDLKIEESPTPAFTISPFDIIGRGDLRAKVIVRLKLEELLSLSSKSSCKYINRMNLASAKEPWYGWISTNEICSSCLSSMRRTSEILSLFADIGVVFSKTLLIRNAKARGQHRFTTKVHMWRIHNPLPQDLYPLSRNKLNWNSPHELYRKFLDDIGKTSIFIITKQ